MEQGVNYAAEKDAKTRPVKEEFVSGMDMEQSANYAAREGCPTFCED